MYSNQLLIVLKDLPDNNTSGKINGMRETRTQLKKTLKTSDCHGT